jgi:monofunctional biosynthetic peptidoglycan transglycosylase
MRRPARVVFAIPAVAFSSVAYVYLTLPDVRPLRHTNPSTTAFMQLRARDARARGEVPRRVQQWVPYNRIADDLKRAVLVAEDSAFWEHEGVDFEQIRESIEVNLERGEFVRGASTITQQLAKNLYLSPSRDPVRKLRELFIARRLEVELTKRRILELYLNVIEWGDGLYGAEAASRAYFRKPALALTAEEAALMASVIINPRRFSPADPTPRLRRRQRLILARMGAVSPPSGPEPRDPGTDEAIEDVRRSTEVEEPLDSQPTESPPPQSAPPDPTLEPESPGVPPEGSPHEVR